MMGQPLFGLIYDHLSTTTDVLFAQKDFSEKQILQELYTRYVCIAIVTRIRIMHI